MDDFDENSWHKIRYHFDVRERLSEAVVKSLKLVVERPAVWKVYVNGNEISPLPDDWWLDRHFPVYHIADYVHTGNNTIELRAEKMSVFAEVMPIYLLGDFELEVHQKGFGLVNPKSTETGYWTERGWPFYSGQVAYHEIIDLEVAPSRNTNYLLNLGSWKGSAAELWVNGQLVEIIGWQSQSDIGAFLKSGENAIELRITGSLKNTLGFHHKELQGWIDGPFSWNQAPEHQPAGTDYKLMPYGIIGK